MSLQVRSATTSDLGDVAEMLVAGFKTAPDAPFVNHRLLRWKYFETGPGWQGARSYLLKEGNDVLAHCGVWPINMGFSDRNVTCLCFTDWVGSRKFPGAGLLLKKKMMSFAETALVVGGSHDTRAIIPRLNFKDVEKIGVFVRVVRPWKQYRTRPMEGMGKDIARLARNIMWSRAPAGTIPDGWSSARLQSFDSVFAPVLARLDQAPYPSPQRSLEYLNFWLRCPAAEITGFSILKRGRVRGYFLLTRLGGQTRIIDIRLIHEKRRELGDVEEQEDWNAAYALATKMAEDGAETCEILAVASTEFSREALLSTGFRQNGSLPLALYDPRAELRSAPPIFWNMIDGDIAYLYDPTSPYNA